MNQNNKPSELAASTYYQSRINQAIQYINEHLEDEISINQLAGAANFSTFHFQRLYKSLQNETPYTTILRLRLEKSIFLLKHRSSLSISDIAFQCGFPSLENFSRQFKSRFKVSPSAFKKDKELQNSRIYQEPQENDFYNCKIESRKAESPNFEVTIEAMPATRIAFIRALFGADGAGLTEAYQQLIDWTEARQLPWQGEWRRFGMSIDDPEVTPAKLYRYDFAIALDEEQEGEGLIEIGTLPATHYATLHCRGDITVVSQAWDYLYQQWLPQSGYLPMHFPAIEEFIKGPEEIGWQTFDMKCRIPLDRFLEKNTDYE